MLKQAVIGLLSYTLLSSTLADPLPSPSNPEEEEISTIVWQIEEYDFNKEYEFSLVSTLMRYWNEKGKYPASLDELKLYEPKVRIDDPFNVFYVDNELKRRQLIYKRKEINECYVWSIGPDGVDDKHAKKYNRKNGWKSEGDISVHLIRNEEAPIGNYQDQAIK